jgi:hypothetical protein
MWSDSITVTAIIVAGQTGKSLYLEYCGFAWFKEALHFAMTIDLHVSEKFDERRLIDFVMRGLFEAPCERRLFNFVSGRASTNSVLLLGSVLRFSVPSCHRRSERNLEGGVSINN